MTASAPGIYIIITPAVTTLPRSLRLLPKKDGTAPAFFAGAGGAVGCLDHGDIEGAAVVALPGWHKFWLCFDVVLYFGF